MRSLGARSPGVCKTRGLVVDGYVENTDPRFQGVENRGSSGKHGVWWKTQEFFFFFFHVILFFAIKLLRGEKKKEKNTF